MRSAVIAALLLALPCAAWATDAPVNLKAGQDYMFAAGGGDGPASLTDPGGGTVASIEANGFDVQGIGFRAAYSATYFMHTGSAVSYAATGPDCGAGVSTLCRIALNHTKRSFFNSDNDSDWWRVKLIAGRVYSIPYAGPSDIGFSVRDASGSIVASNPDVPSSATLRFRPAAAGTYFLEFALGDSTPDDHHYAIGLR